MASIPKPALIVIVASLVLFIVSVSALTYIYQRQSELRKTRIIKPIMPARAEKKEYQFNNEKDKLKFEEIMIDYYAVQDMATNIFPIDTTSAGRDKSLSDIKNIGLYYWNRDLEMLDSLQKLDLPQELVAQTDFLRSYCELNRECYLLMYKAIDEHSKAYENELNIYFEKIKQKREFIINQY